MKKAELINLIAEHFTGPLVAHNSICLGLEGVHATMAKRFFETREKLGIRGWATKEEAVKMLKASMLS